MSCTLQESLESVVGLGEESRFGVLLLRESEVLEMVAEVEGAGSTTLPGDGDRLVANSAEELDSNLR